jgi:RNA polymerase primary sigma factor
MKAIKINKSINPTIDSSIYNIYLKDVRKYKILDLEEELNLIRKAQTGDSEALNKVVNSNLRFVISLAKQYSSYGCPILDLINEGNIGLIEAIKGFDETKGFKFLSFAVWCIRKYILQSLNKNLNIIKKPSNKQSIQREYTKVRRVLEQLYGREVNDSEVAEVTQIPIKDFIDVNTTIISLETTTDEEEDFSVLDTLTDGVESDKGLRDQNLNKVLNILFNKCLTRNEIKVIKNLYGIDTPELTPTILADKMKITATRVLQLRQNALNKLRKEYKHLQEYI